MKIGSTEGKSPVKRSCKDDAKRSVVTTRGQEVSQDSNILYPTMLAQYKRSSTDRADRTEGAKAGHVL